jgi:Zn-dependent protease/CBS domain-containing protein
MQSTFTLGRIAGIPIGINWSWLLVFALIAWSLAARLFPETNPGLADGTYVAMALAATVLFFTSLLLHELGHALQARREQMEIDGITLWLFGGVAKFKGSFPSAGAEFRIAVAGPAVSLGLGLLFVLVAWATDMHDAVDGVAGWLGFINLILLAFNLLPALPLDGGRVFRAALWHFKGDLTSSTRIAAAAGRGFAYLFIAGGIAVLFLAGAWTGLWFVVLGWFLLQAATAEDRYIFARRALGGLRVRDLFVSDPVTTRPDITLAEFMDDVVWKTRYTTYPVAENGHAVGLLPFRRVAEVPRSEWDTRRVRDCMLPREEVPVVAPNDRLIDAATELAQSDVSRALVLEGDRLVGLLSGTDIARALEIRKLRERRD